MKLNKRNEFVNGNENIDFWKTRKRRVLQIDDFFASGRNYYSVTFIKIIPRTKTVTKRLHAKRFSDKINTFMV
jgi:hypothetical protein